MKRGGGRKPRPQKGSGKSRHGSIRSPLFRGGGRAHPKRPTDHSYRLNQKVVSLGLKVALSDKYRRGALIVLESSSLEKHKTGAFGKQLTDLGINLDTQRVLIVGKNNSMEAGQANMHRAGSNLPAVTSQVADQANVYDLVRSHLLVVCMDSLAELEERFDNPKTTGHVQQLLNAQ